MKFLKIILEFIELSKFILIFRRKMIKYQYNLKNMKEFKWQYSNEKVLFKIREHIISFIFSKFWMIFTSILLASIISFLLFYFEKNLFAIIFIIFYLLFIIIYYFILYKDSFLYFTSRRVIKQIRNWIFFRHRKELKIIDIKSSMSNKKGFFQTILRIWNLKIEWTEKEANIYFSWLKEYQELSNYIWRVIDYIKLNWHTDNISAYKNKKTRLSKK